MRTLAILDDHAVFQGLETVDDFDGAPPSNRVAVSEHCDLVPGCAQWDAKQTTFHIIKPPAVRRAVPIEEQVRLMATGLIALRDGKPLPADLLAWLSAYERLFDSIGSVDSLR